MPDVNMSLVDRAIEYAENKHKSQLRKDGSPYIIHPLAVAEIVVEMGLDIPELTRVFLHLQKLGLDIPQVYTMEQAVSALKKLKEGNRHA